jgi:TolB-like protein/Tfp pilus assembly protein PilF
VAAAAALAAVAVGVVLLSSYRSRPASTEVKGAPVRSVAVLPLRNLAGDPEDEYLSDGITESLIGALSKVEGLKVIARGSAFTFKGREVDPREAGRQLGVESVLEGSVRREGDRVRVEARLVSTSDGRVLWASDTYDRPAGDIFAVQDEVARDVAGGLRLRLSGADGRRLAARYTDSVGAYEAYLKGRYSLNKRTPEGITKATEYFQQAIAEDPNYALAYAALAESYDKSYWFMRQHPREVLAKEREAADRALALDDSLAEAHVAMATVYANEWRLREAAAEEERAIEINPGDAEAHHNYAYRLIDLLRPEEAVAEIKRARELDPLNEVMNVDVGQILLFARRYDEAVAALRDAVEMEPGSANAHWNLAGAYERKGMYAEAVAEYAESLTLSGEGREAAALKKAYESGGVRGFWREWLEQLKSRPGQAEPSEVANIYTELGDRNQAFAWLERAYQERSPALVGLASSPWLDALRSDPRYSDLLRRTGLP